MQRASSRRLEERVALPPNSDSYARLHEARVRAVLCAPLIVQVSDASGRKANGPSRACNRKGEERAALSVPVAPRALLQARPRDRARLARTAVPSPDRGGRYPRHRLTINTGTAVTKFHDERDILAGRRRMLG